ncbi:alpha/beta fold hydrolase [Crossiella cryophila]|uniref:Pimeloyl-ACP methyl ester carboxylesterase n=1 Tax=Crossiella cryophila TaxID=43355 RepID=A0A7W7FTA9_9PSEU|nr:alpha/beta hydrolase [Crossiella cryophila]MBB4677961.1 pimeloyl-ACP methyl ester carboxylesterase [Crossiella cryophila]
MPTFLAPDGTKLTYHVEGTGAPLICLPGGPMVASGYLGDLAGLTAHRTLIRLDLRGTGESAIPADLATYRCDRQVADVEALRVHLGLDRIDVLAHSAGGDLTLSYAGAYPERISSLVLLNARARAVGIEFPQSDRDEAIALRVDEPWYPAAIAALAKIRAGEASPELWDKLQPFTYRRWNADSRADAEYCAAHRNVEAAAAYPGEGAFDPEATRAGLARLSAPVLLVSGSLDSGPRPKVVESMVPLFGNATHVELPQVAHIPWLDNPEAFRATVIPFLTAS